MDRNSTSAGCRAGRAPRRVVQLGVMIESGQDRRHLPPFDGRRQLEAHASATLAGRPVGDAQHGPWAAPAESQGGRRNVALIIRVAPEPDSGRSLHSTRRRTLPCEPLLRPGAAIGSTPSTPAGLVAGLAAARQGDISAAPPSVHAGSARCRRSRPDTRHDIRRGAMAGRATAGDRFQLRPALLKRGRSMAFHAEFTQTRPMGKAARTLRALDGQERPCCRRPIGGESALGRSSAHERTPTKSAIRGRG